MPFPLPAFIQRFSLVRKIIEISGIALDAPAPCESDADQLGAALRTPTRIYQKAAATALTTGGVSGIVHVTGGGLIENPPRVFGDKVSFRLDCTATPLPPVFSWIRDTGNMELLELARTFNCGIGLIIYVDPSKAGEVLHALQTGPEPGAYIVGDLVARDDQPAVILDRADHWRQRT